MNLLKDDNLVTANHGLDVIRAATGTTATLLIWAVVIKIKDAISVIIFFRAAIPILEAILVFLNQRAEVRGVLYAVIVVVQLRTTVPIAMTI